MHKDTEIEESPTSKKTHFTEYKNPYVLPDGLNIENVSESEYPVWINLWNEKYDIKILP